MTNSKAWVITTKPFLMLEIKFQVESDRIACVCSGGWKLYNERGEQDEKRGRG